MLINMNKLNKQADRKLGRLFQVLCKLKKSDIRYVNSYVRAEPFLDGSALICIIQRILGMSIKPALIR